MNVLILSAAAKVLLVRAFIEAVRPRGGRVVAADLGPDNAALFEADGAVLLPRSDAPHFAHAIEKACADRSVGLIVPTRDGELAALSECRARLAAGGATALVAAPQALQVCQDKRRFVGFCRDHGFATPRTYEPGEPPDTLPAFARLVVGAASAGARRVDSLSDVPPGDDVLVQALDTAPEYTVDALLDLRGRPLQAVARRRLLVKAGESVKSRVEDAPELTQPALALCAALGLVGHNVVQAFYTPGQEPRFIEINPRFGGASNLSIRAGLASPERIVQMMEGDDERAARPRPIIHGLTMLRYAEDRFVTSAELAAAG